jgi:hypothetical protein
MDGDLQRLVGQELLESGAVPGRLRQPHHRARLGVECELQRSGEVSARVAERVLHLQPEPHGAVLADERRSGHRQQRAQHDLAVAPHGVGQGHRRRGGRHELAQRDDVTLTRQPLERTRDVRRRGAGRAAVAGLVPPTGAARARLAGADLTGGDGRLLGA